MKILVTGSKGFIGRELVKELKKNGFSVKEFDLVLGHDVCKEEQVNEAVKGADAIIHLAALIEENAGKQKLCDVNVGGTRNLLKAGEKAGVKRFVFLSTVGVMGKIRKEAEEQTPLKPQTHYEQSKAQAEKIVLEHKEKLDITVLRSAMVFGPNPYWKQIIKLIKRGFPVIGSGKNHFQMIYFKDLVNAIVFCLQKPKTIGELFIVAGKEKPSLKELYALIQKELGIEREIKTIPVWMGKLMAVFSTNKLLSNAYINRLIRERNYSTKKIESLGWKANYSLEKAVKETIQELK